MSIIRINPKWMERLQTDIAAHHPIDETISFTPGKQWLIEFLSKKNRPFKVYQLGCGVTRITTDTDVCPCCKKSLKEVV